jgi:hypothetical protein
VTPLWTNVLTDWALRRLVYSRSGCAERVFRRSRADLLWGAFFAVDATTGRRPWLFFRCWPLSYGLVFHFGFLNSIVRRPPDLGTVVAFPGGRFSLCTGLLAHARRGLGWTILAYLMLLGSTTPWRMAAPGGRRGCARRAASFLMSRYPYNWSRSVVERNRSRRITAWADLPLRREVPGPERNDTNVLVALFWSHRPERLLKDPAAQI